MWLSSLCCDVLVSDSALTRRAFPGAFVNPAAPQVDVEAQQLPLSDAEGALDAVLGMGPEMGGSLGFQNSSQSRMETN